MDKNYIKSIIFIIDHGIQMVKYIDFLSFKLENSLRSVVIINSSSYENMNENHKIFFDKIYVVDDNIQKNDLCLLNFHDLHKIIKDELTLISSPKCTKLIAFNEYTVLLTAKLRDAFGIEGPSLSESLPFRDKVIMKRAVENKVRVPLNLIFCKELYEKAVKNYYEILKNKLGLPFIIKPIDAASSIGVKLIENIESFETFNQMFQYYDGTYEAEEYIEGDLYHCDIIYKNGKPLISLCSKFNLPLLSMMSGKVVGGIPLKQDDPLKHKLTDFCDLAVSDINIPDGIIHTEVFVTNNSELVFLETACRVGGAGVIPAYLNSYGINLAELDFKIKCGLSFVIPQLHTESYCFWAIIPKKSGEIKNLLYPNLKSKYTIEWHVKEGEILEDTTMIGERAGTMYAYNKNYNQLYEDFQKISDLEFMGLE